MENLIDRLKSVFARLGIAWDNRFTRLSESCLLDQIAHWERRLTEPEPPPRRPYTGLDRPGRGPVFYDCGGGFRRPGHRSIAT